MLTGGDRLETRPLVYYVYYSQQKIMQLYQQLPESRVLAQKNSFSRNSHIHADMHPIDEEHMKPLRISHIDNSGTENCYHEAMFDKNEMYQHERVMQALRKRGQLMTAERNMKFRPGQYYETEGCFTPDEQAQAPEDYVWLQAPAAGQCPGARLLCSRFGFTGERAEAAYRETWACGGALPLCAVVLCLGCGDETLCGVPLTLALSSVHHEKNF